MKNQYIISTINEAGTKLYFLYDYRIFSVKHKSTFSNKKRAKEVLEFSKKFANSQTMIDNLQIEIN